MHLHPLAYTREAERLQHESRRMDRLGELAQATRLAQLAELMRKRAN